MILERKEERGRNINVERDPTQNLCTCPERGSNPQPFSVWVDAPTNGATITLGVMNLGEHKHCVALAKFRVGVMGKH